MTQNKKFLKKSLEKTRGKKFCIPMKIWKIRMHSKTICLALERILSLTYEKKKIYIYSPFFKWFYNNMSFLESLNLWNITRISTIVRSHLHNFFQQHWSQKCISRAGTHFLYEKIKIEKKTSPHILEKKKWRLQTYFCAVGNQKCTVIYSFSISWIEWIRPVVCYMIFIIFKNISIMLKKRNWCKCSLTVN